MFRNNRSTSLVLGLLVSMVALGLAPQPADAAMVTAFAFDKNCSSYFVQWSTDVPPDAWRIEVRQGGPAGPLVDVVGGHPHYATTGFAVSRYGVLTCPQGYWFKLKIRWIHGGPWVIERSFPFTTP